MGGGLYMIQLENINETLIDSEFNVLIEYANVIEKSLDMGSYLYMEADEPKSEAGDAPKVDGVNALERFWNWLKRVVYAIRARITSFFASKKIDKLVKKLNKCKDGQTFKVAAKTIDAMQVMIDVYEMKNNQKYEYNPKINWQKMADAAKKDASFSERFTIGVETDPIIDRDKKDQKTVSVDDLKKTAEDIKKITSFMKEEVINLNKSIKSEKNNLSDEVVKSENFQQFIKFLTYTAKSTLFLIKLIGNWCRDIATVISMDEINHPTGNFEIAEIIGYSGKTATAFANDIKRLVHKSKDNSIILQWYNSGNDKYKQYYREKISKVLDKYPEKDYNIILIYYLNKDDNWYRVCSVLPKSEINFSEIATRLNGGKLNDATTDNASGGKAILFIFKDPTIRE